MNSIAVVAAVICIAALGCSIISVVAPQGNTRRILNTVLGAFILCSMLVPIKNAIADFNVNISISESSDSLTASAEEAYNRAVIIETKAGLESTLTAYLEGKGISVKDTEIQLSSYDNGGIYISSISIYISKGDNRRTEEIKILTKEKFEVEPQIILR